MNTEVQTPGPTTEKVAPEEIVLEDDDEMMDSSPAPPVITNGNSHTSPKVQDEVKSSDAVKKPNGNANGVDCIEIDDDDVMIEEPPQKKSKPAEEPVKEKSTTPAPTSKTPQPDKPKKEPELTNYSALLDRLEEYINKALKNKESVDRKLLDALLAAINVQVQKEPYSVRRLILDKQLVLPNTISFPPSQIVDLIIEHDPDVQLSRVIQKMFGEERPRLTDGEKKERQQLKSAYAAPAMTKMLMEIGQDLVQEATYSDIVHARNLPEVPKNVETYKQVAAQLRPVWENLRDKNIPFKLKQLRCNACDFQTDSLINMSEHKQQLHLDDKRRFRCGMCPEFNTSETRMRTHYLEKHGMKAFLPDDEPAKVQCPICEENFLFKGHRDAHLKVCKRDQSRSNNLQSAKNPEHSSIVNRWLWPRPPTDPTIAAQQQDLQKQQLLKQQQQQQRLAMAAAAARNNTPSMNQAALNVSKAATNFLAGQQIQNQLKNMPQAQRQQIMQLLAKGNSSFPPAVMQAVQAQLQKIQTQQATAAFAANLHQQALQLTRSLQQQQQQQKKSAPLSQTQGQRRPGPVVSQLNKLPTFQPGSQRAGVSGTAALSAAATSAMTRPEETACEICDEKQRNRLEYLTHLQNGHQLVRGKTASDFEAGPPLACSRCRDRFWSYEGLERHLVMNHYLVTSDLLTKAQNKLDGGRCKICSKSFAFNILQHLASDHSARLCSAEIMFSCDVCPFKCSSYQKLEAHLTESHPKTGVKR